MIKYINVLAFIGMVFMNYLANALPLNNKTTGELSDSFPNLFVPAGITFSIWGIIYLLLGVFCIVQFQSLYREVVLRTGWLFVLSCLLNALWIVCWHYQKLSLSLLVMLGLLTTLVFIGFIYRDQQNTFVKAAFGIYLGWICIATIANVTALLVHNSMRGSFLPEEVWAILMIAAGALIISLTIFRLNNPFAGLAVIWAFLGIILKRYSDYRIIAIVAGIALVMVLLITILVFQRKTSELG